MQAKSINTQRRAKPVFLTPHEARSEQSKLLVLDVQNPKFMTRMIPGAQRLNIDISLKDIARSQPVLVTCLSGGRSLTAAQQMIRRGYRQVYVLKGGLMAWQRAGYTVWLTELPA